MPAAADTKQKKARIVRWRGILADSPRMLRAVVAIMLVVAGATLAFIQLGFVNVTLPGGDSGYVVVLLQAVALGSLLLGTLAGTLLGFAIGAVLLAHSSLLPLDHYELVFVTPITSVVMFALTGFLLGVLFGFVLRNNPGPVKRAIYIALVCIVVSSLYSAGFVMYSIGELIDRIATNLGPDAADAAVEQMAVSMALQFGSVHVQIQGTASLMAVLCILGDFVTRRIRARQGTLSVRAVFGSWLAVVVALAFMVISAASFAAATIGELREAGELMDSEMEYLSNQVQMATDRFNILLDAFDKGGLDIGKIEDEELVKLAESLDTANVLEGYSTRGGGTVIIASDGMVRASDDARFAVGTNVSDYFSDGALDAIDYSAGTSEMQRIIFNDVGGGQSDLQAGAAESTRPYIAYVEASDINVNGSDDDGDGEADLLLTERVIIMRTPDQVFAKRGEVMTWSTLSEFVLLAAVFALVFQLLYRVVLRRIDEENAALALVTGGDLTARATAGGTREFESLTNGINETVDALKGWISEAESRIDAELATAKAIQESALPSTFPPYPDILKFDIYASMNAARKVGGDFYDFFLIGDDNTPESGKLGFVVADVSGKGVPAALFMMKAKALLRDYVGSGMELSVAVEEANRMLCDGNDAGMFVTAWVGVLDYGTGHVDYVNAGHNPPLMWSREGGWQWMDQKSGLVLGLFEMPYEAFAVDCEVGDTFLLYTDGVTEAFDVGDNLYGEDRLLAVAEGGFLMHPRELLESVRSDVASYAAGAEQSDDITILVLEYGAPPEVTATLEVPAIRTELDHVNQFLHAELDRRLCPQRVQNQLDIAVEELFVNVCSYAYPDATADNPGSVRIQRTYNVDPQSIMVDIIDEGIPYNPLAKPDAVTPDNIEDVPIGGLGILMAKRCTDEMIYERIDDANVVTIVKKW